MGLIGTRAEAQGDDSLRKVVAIQQAELQRLKSAAFAVGSLQFSLLTEAQFQRVMGQEWVLMDGRDCKSSKYASLTGNSEVPDGRGNFLRMFKAGLTGELAQFQDDATAVNGLRDNGHEHPVVDGGHSHEASKRNRSGDNLVGVSNDGAGWGAVNLGADDGYRTGKSPSGIKINTGNAALVGDNETRPINIAVNIFIKIN